MKAEPDRSVFWRELRAALVASKKSCTVAERDALLEQAGDWAQRLAETADPAGPEPRQEAFFLDVALADIGDDPWTIEM